MLKNDLREMGCSEQEKYQKSSIITGIWVFSALAMIAFVFISIFSVTGWKNSGGDFADFMDEIAFTLRQVFGSWTFLVYLLLWALMLLTLFFLTRSDSNGQKPPKRLVKYILRAVFAVLALAALFYSFTLLAEMPESGMRSGSGSGGFDFFDIVMSLLAFIGPLSILVYLIFWELLYLAVKLITTIFVCRNKDEGIKLEILKGTAMPVCSCREAFSFRHILATYLFPFIFMYSFLLLLCASADDTTQLFYHTITAIFMSFFLSYDLTLVLYSVYMKIRYKMDYISIDHHIYEVTLFKKSYVK
jgi:hypothetical protein